MAPTPGMVSCYFWCTLDGELPKVVGDGSKDYSELLDELTLKQHEIRLRPSFVVTHGIPQTQDRTSLAISSAFVYKISLSSETLEKQGGDGDYSKFQFVFERHFSDCKFNFICPSMSPDQGCSDMWFQVSPCSEQACKLKGYIG